MHRALVIIAGLLFVVAPASAQSVEEVNARIEMVLGDHTKYEAAFEALQTAVAEGDAEAVAGLAAYPLIVKVDGRREIASGEEFAAAYDEIMTEEITSTIAGQTYENLFVNNQGIMFGNGEVWMAGVCEDDSCEVWDVKIITIQSTEG